MPGVLEWTVDQMVSSRKRLNYDGSFSYLKKYLVYITVGFKNRHKTSRILADRGTKTPPIDEKLIKSLLGEIGKSMRTDPSLFGSVVYSAITCLDAILDNSVDFERLEIIKESSLIAGILQNNDLKLAIKIKASSGRSRKVSLPKIENNV